MYLDYLVAGYQGIGPHVRFKFYFCGENDVEVSDADYGILNDHCESEMDTEVSSVVAVSESVDSLVTVAIPIASTTNVEKEQSETPPPVHTQAPHVKVRATLPIVNKTAGTPHGTATPDNNKVGPSNQLGRTQPPQVDFLVRQDA